MNQTIAYISTTSSYLKEIIDKKSLRIFAADLILSNASTELQIFYKILDSEKLSWLTHIPFIITNELGDIYLCKLKNAVYEKENSIIEFSFINTQKKIYSKNDIIELDSLNRFRRDESDILIQIITLDKENIYINHIKNYSDDLLYFNPELFRKIIEDSNETEKESVTDLESFFRKMIKLINIENPDFNERFFRGHSSLTYRLEPSNFRFYNGKRVYLHNEDKLYRELIINEPLPFNDDKNALEILTRMQHFGLYTRLLDITSNPLTALFFACQNKNNEDGEVIIIRPNKKNIKYYDSDTVSCITNIAKLNINDKNSLTYFLLKKPFPNKLNYSLTSHKKFLHFIKEEKPYFQNLVKPSDLNRVICIKSKLNNKRILAQTGAFLLFGLKAKMNERSDSDYQIHRIRIAGSAKSKILKDLDLININLRTIYPTLENTAKYLQDKYK
ncbi:FRG domain-containing protein [Acinetobacter sp. WCHA29]|uniref:FRG domain-containing protein n=1 Tax=Acinetobacter sp. WCHA29 TaxID=2004649 RepID=UPI000B3CFF0D|nr:FRG domain-containing protein [Acinetobacter sp. WCHA29]